MSITFMIFPPEHLNEAAVRSAALLETHLETTFPGYRFELVDLRFVQPANPDRPVRFGDGTRFVPVPIMGTVNADEWKPMPDLTKPPVDLCQAIVEACHAFDAEAYRRHAA